MARLFSPDGGHDASPLVSTQPGLGIALALGVLLLALVLGAVAARFCGAKPGLSTAGIVVAWAAWRTGTIDQMIRTAHSGDPLVRQAIEAGLFGVISVAVIFIISALGRLADDRSGGAAAMEGTLRATSRAGGGEFTLALLATAYTLKKLFKGKGGVAAIPISILAGGLIAGLIAATPLKGQAVLAATFGAVAAAAAGRLVEEEISFPFLYAPVVLLAIIGPLTGLTAGGGVNVVRASYSGALFPLANITALDWIAGGLLGIPLGAAWAGSMVEKRVTA
jgi:hypothetical protein